MSYSHATNSSVYNKHTYLTHYDAHQFSSFPNHPKTKVYLVVGFCLNFGVLKDKTFILKLNLL